MSSANEALRIRPIAGAAPTPRETPAEGVMIAGHFIAGKVCHSVVALITDCRQCVYMADAP